MYIVYKDMLKFVPCAQTQKCPRRNKRGLAVLCCAVYFRSSSGLDVQNLLWMGRRRACLVLSTHSKQLIYFILPCQPYCWLFSVDSCTAVWTTIGNVIAAARKLLTFEAVMAGIAVVKFQYVVTSSSSHHSDQISSA